MRSRAENLNTTRQGSKLRWKWIEIQRTWEITGSVVYTGPLYLTRLNGKWVLVTRTGTVADFWSNKRMVRLWLWENA